MRALIAIPHYFAAGQDSEHGSTSATAGSRAAALTQCVRSLRTQHDSPQEIWYHGGDRLVMQPANAKRRVQLDIVVCTTGDRHLLGQLPLPPGRYRHHPTTSDPRLLGFECHKVLRDGLGGYELYAYMEDDLLVRDPSFFEKLLWFGTHVGDDALVQPNRYEAVLTPTELKKVYIDPEMRTAVEMESAEVREVPWCARPVRLRRAGNPHAGCFFLSERQLRHWAAQPFFLDYSTDFVGPLESAATLGILRAFKVFKPAPQNANVLEIQHYGQAWSQRLPRVRIRP